MFFGKQGKRKLFKIVYKKVIQPLDYDVEPGFFVYFRKKREIPFLYSDRKGFVKEGANISKRIVQGQKKAASVLKRKITKYIATIFRKKTFYFFFFFIFNKFIKKGGKSRVFKMGLKFFYLLKKEFYVENLMSFFQFLFAKIPLVVKVLFFRKGFFLGKVPHVHYPNQNFSYFFRYLKQEIELFYRGKDISFMLLRILSLFFFNKKLGRFKLLGYSKKMLKKKKIGFFLKKNKGKKKIFKKKNFFFRKILSKRNQANVKFFFLIRKKLLERKKILLKKRMKKRIKKGRKRK